MKTLVVLVVFLGACGSSSDGADGATASIMLSGAQSATLPALAVASHTDGDAFAIVGVSVLSPPSPFTSGSISIRLPGSPAAGSYASSSFEVGVLEVSTSDGKSWTAFSTPAIGSVGALQISSLDVLSRTGTLTLYTIHGSLASSSLVAKQGQSGGDLMMTAKF